MNALKYHLDSFHLKSCISPNTCINDAVSTMKKNGDSYVLVLENGVYIGIFTNSDLRNKVVSKNLPLDSTPIAQVMTKDVVFFDIEQSIDECLDKLEDHDFRHVPVVKKGKVVAVLSARDLFKIALNQVSQEREHLIEYVTA
jgi:CBS domain-containing protein